MNRTTGLLKKPYTARRFETLDALRSLAFLKVFLLHLPAFSIAWFAVVKNGGGIAVQFFFVLSGFLITYRIGEEQRHTGGFRVRRFLLQRALRIWPLYFLMLGWAFITHLRYAHTLATPGAFVPSWWYPVFFLENYEMMMQHGYPYVLPMPVMWSLCVEEHFYIVWSGLLYCFGYRNLRRIIPVCSCIAVVARILSHRYGFSNGDLLTNFDFFAIGAIPAYFLLTQRERTEAFAARIPRSFQIVFVIVLAGVVSTSYYWAGELVNLWMSTVLALLFAGLILLTLSPHSFVRISSSNILSRMGKYTYGLYMYHTLVIGYLITGLLKFHVIAGERPVLAIPFIAVALLLTLGCAILSWRFFEQPFLRLKKRLS